MDHPTFKVIVESLPPSHLDTVLVLITGIVLPVLLFIASKVFAKKAEKAANQFTVELHSQQQISFQKDRAINLLNDIYQNYFGLIRVKSYQKQWEEWSEILQENSDKHFKTAKKELQLHMQDGLQNALFKNIDLQNEHTEYTIKVKSNVGLLSTIIGDTETEKIQSLVSKGIVETDVSKSLVIGEQITEEINNLSQNITNDQITIKTLNQTLKRTG